MVRKRKTVDRPSRRRNHAQHARSDRPACHGETQFASERDCVPDRSLDVASNGGESRNVTDPGVHLTAIAGISDFERGETLRPRLKQGVLPAARNTSRQFYSAVPRIKRERRAGDRNRCLARQRAERLLYVQGTTFRLERPLSRRQGRPRPPKCKRREGGRGERK